MSSICRQNCSKRLLDAVIGIYINVKSMAFFDLPLYDSLYIEYGSDYVYIYLL